MVRRVFVEDCMVGVQEEDRLLGMVYYQEGTQSLDRHPWILSEEIEMLPTVVVAE
jgi:hypothetical protein